MTPLVLFAIAFAARVAVAGLFVDPAYPDSYYYVSVARQLAAGHGFSVDYIWNFADVGGTLPAAGVLPIPSNAHWLPLATLVQVPFIWLLGPSALASALPFWLAGAAAAPLAWAIGRDIGVGDGVAVLAGLLTAVPAALAPFLAQPDNFGLLMTIGALALWLAYRAGRGERWAFVAGGLVVGLAALARNDGLLLGVPFAVAALRGLRDPARRRASLVAGLACVAACAVVIGPWLARQLAVFGSLSPSAANGRMLWGIDYRQQWSAGELPTLDSLLALGAGPLLASRLEGLAAALGSFALLPLAAVLVPLALIGAWQRRRDPAFAPFFMYGALLLAVSSVLFAGHVAHGMFMHSAVALVPHTFLLVGVGLGGAIDWMAARRPAWQPQRARSVFGGGLVAVALVAALVQGQATLAAWRAAEQPRRELAAALAELPSTDVLMAADPGALNYLYGRPAIVTPDDPLPLIERAARLYGVRWLVLEQAQIVPSLVPVLRGELHPGWLSAPLAVVPAHQPALAAAGAVDASSEPPLAALYAVCLEPTDTRCVR